MTPPSERRVCGYRPCGSSLDGRNPLALYCSRSHKELAKQARARQAAARSGRLGFCSVCGGTFTAAFRRGASPKYCAVHHPKQPCAGCGRTLRHLAVSQFCRNCQAARHERRARIWTRLCDVCGNIFQGLHTSNLCDSHVIERKEEL